MGLVDKFVKGAKEQTENFASGDVFGDKRAADKQEAAAAEALRLQVEEADKARKFAVERSDLAVGLAGDQTAAGVGAVQAGGAAAQGALAAGLTGAEGALTAGQAGAEGALASGFGQARDDLGAVQDLQRFTGGATTAIDSFDVTGRDTEIERLQREGIQGDAGFQFRQQQGEQAINRAAAARGGRFSGRTLKELQGFNSGLASQEAGAAFGRASQVDALRQQQLLNQAGRTDAAGLQAQQNQAGLAGLGFGAQGQLSGLSAQQGQLGAGLASGTGSQLAGLFSGTAGQQASAFQQTGGQQGALLGQLGQTQANAAIGAGGQGTALSQSLMGAFGGPTQFAGAGTQAQGNTAKEIGGSLLGAWIGSAGAEKAKQAT